MPTLFNKTPIRRTASLSDCGRYRYWLRREWDGGDGRTVCFLMLNPSTADAVLDDPTIRRCIGFAREWGFSCLEVRNLYPLRATKPADLFATSDRSGGAMGYSSVTAANHTDMIVAAWGANAQRKECRERVKAILPGLDKTKLFCLELTAAGHPRHPLMVKKTRKPVKFP